MNISQAVTAMQSGSKVQRAVWITEGRNWLLFLTAGVTNMPAADFTNAALSALVASLPGGVINSAPILTLYVPHLSGGTGNGSVHFGWVPEQVDVLATDWTVVP
jgi:hypothetical protein